MADIKFNPWKGVVWKGSHLLYLITFLSALSQVLTHDFWIAKRIKQQEHYPKWIAELWFVISLSIIILVFVFWKPGKNLSTILVLIFSGYALHNSLAATLRDVFLAPNLHGGVIQIYDSQRWLLLTILSLVEVVLCFGLVELCYGDKFDKTINDPITAIYFSASTFFTIGYGDIHPKTTFAKLIILAEVIYFLLFLSLKIPVIVATIKLEGLRKIE